MSNYQQFCKGHGYEHDGVCPLCAQGVPTSQSVEQCILDELRKMNSKLDRLISIAHVR